MVVEHGQRGVQVIGTGSTNLEGPPRTKHRGDFGVCALVCASRSPPTPFRQPSAGRPVLVDVAGGRAISDRGHPAGIGSRTHQLVRGTGNWATTAMSCAMNPPAVY